MRSEKEIRKQIKKIIDDCGSLYGSVSSPRARSKIMALEWVLRERSDI